LKGANYFERAPKEATLIDMDMVNLGDLISMKCYIRYWRHFASKWHILTLELVTIKILSHANTIKDSYNAHKLII
jgi:hypothetical protein